MWYGPTVCVWAVCPVKWGLLWLWQGLERITKVCVTPHDNRNWVLQLTLTALGLNLVWTFKKKKKSPLEFSWGSVPTLSYSVRFRQTNMFGFDHTCQRSLRLVPLAFSSGITAATTVMTYGYKDCCKANWIFPFVVFWQQDSGSCRQEQRQSKVWVYSVIDSIMEMWKQTEVVPGCQPDWISS